MAGVIVAIPMPIPQPDGEHPQFASARYADTSSDSHGCQRGG